MLESAENVICPANKAQGTNDCKIIFFFFFLLNIAEHEIFSANKYENANNVDEYEEIEFHIYARTVEPRYLDLAYPKEQFILFSTLFYMYISNFRSQITYSFVKRGCSIHCFPLSTLICQGTDISKCFSEFLGIRDNESRLYVHVTCDVPYFSPGQH